MKDQGGCDLFFNFLLKSTWVGLLWSGLKVIFLWKAVSLIFFMLCFMESRDVSLGKSFALEDSSPDK